MPAFGIVAHDRGQPRAAAQAASIAATLPAPPRRCSCRPIRSTGMGASGLIRSTSPHR